jgi:hypothetical protein
MFMLLHRVENTILQKCSTSVEWVLRAQFHSLFFGITIFPFISETFPFLVIHIWPIAFSDINPFTGDFDLPKRICLNGLFWFTFDKVRHFL